MASTMFKVGADYEFTLIEGDEEGQSVWKVAAYEHPLLKITNPHEGEKIVNVTSPNFVSAKPYNVKR